MARLWRISSLDLNRWSPSRSHTTSKPNEQYCCNSTLCLRQPFDWKDIKTSSWRGTRSNWKKSPQPNIFSPPGSINKSPSKKAALIKTNFTRIYPDNTVHNLPSTSESQSRMEPVATSTIRISPSTQLNNNKDPRYLSILFANYED